MTGAARQQRYRARHYWEDHQGYEMQLWGTTERQRAFIRLIGDYRSNEAHFGAADQQWRERALCKGMDTSLFFPPQGHAVSQEVQETCAACPVREECLEDALRFDRRSQVGYQGGVMGHHRAQIKRDRNREKNLEDDIAS